MKLTNQQELLFKSYVNKWMNIAYATYQPNDEIKINQAINLIYKSHGLNTPTIHIVDSPIAVLNTFHQITGHKASISDFCYGQHDAYWLATYDFFYQEIGLEKECRQILPFIKLAQCASWTLIYDEVAIVSKRPIQMHIDENYNLSNMYDMALTFNDGFGIYAVEGINVPKETITNNIDIDAILGKYDQSVEYALIKVIKHKLKEYTK
jgi:hypothetical protein